MGKVWSRQKGVKRTNRQTVEEEEEERNEKDGIRTRQGFGELKIENILGRFGRQMSGQPMIFPFVQCIFTYFQYSLIHDLALNVV